MDLETLRHKLQRQPATDSFFQEFAVLIPLFEQAGELHVLFEVRSERLQSQPGEICLPGGRLEAGERPDETALRETCEELGICPGQVELLGAATPVHTPFRYALYPYVGWLKPFAFPGSLKPNPHEVSDVFSVPLRWFMENPPLIYAVETRFSFPEDFPFHLIQNGREYAWKTGTHSVHFYTFGDRVIWGMTARILYEFCEKLGKNT